MVPSKPLDRKGSTEGLSFSRASFSFNNGVPSWIHGGWKTFHQQDWERVGKGKGSTYGVRSSKGSIVVVLAPA